MEGLDGLLMPLLLFEDASLLLSLVLTLDSESCSEELFALILVLTVQGRFFKKVPQASKPSFKILFLCDVGMEDKVWGVPPSQTVSLEK